MLNADAVATVDDGPALCAVAGASGSAPARLRSRRVQRLGEFGKGAVPFAIFASPYARGCAWRSAAPERVQSTVHVRCCPLPGGRAKRNEIAYNRVTKWRADHR